MTTMSTPLKQIIVVCGYGASDIGKGWLSASIAKAMARTQVIKIDPFLNQTFPTNLGITLDGKIVSDDFSTYQSVGIRVNSADNVLNGQVIANVLQGQEKHLQRGDEKKLTFADLAEAMAYRLSNIIRIDAERVVIEIGGTITDREHTWVPDALRLLGQMLGVTPQIVLMTYLELSETGYRVKTHNVRNAIRTARSCFGLPILSCFVRRRFVPETVKSDDIRCELFNIAFETQFPVNRIILEENYLNLDGLCDFIASLHLFGFEQKRVFVSACLLGIRCRYNGKGKMIDLRTLASLHSSEVITACPEVLGGIGIPRLPCEILNGDGRSVIEGTARVKNIEGVDMTRAFISGAERTFMLIQRADVSEIFLCEMSPSCGSSRIYDGSFSDVERDGIGVLTALLIKNGYGHLLRSVRPGASA
jgi:uncharacterized protein YbbK (DUF523 family)